MAVDVRLELHEPGHAALVGGRFVESRPREDAPGASLDRHAEQEAPLFDEVAVQDLVQPGLHLTGHHVGEEAEAAEVHAKQGHLLVGQGAGRAQERPVAGDHHDEIALFPERGTFDDRQILSGTGVPALGVEHHVQAARAQHAEQPAQRFAHPRIAALRDEADGLEHRVFQGLRALGDHAGAESREDAGDGITSAPAVRAAERSNPI